MSKPETKVTGGTSLLDPEDKLKLDPEEAEKVENENLRDPDQLNTALSQILGKPVGGFMSNKPFLIERPNTRAEDLTFDRFYWEHNLLVDFFTDPSKDDVSREETYKTVDEHRAFAKEHGFKYLAVVGQATAADIQQALV
jgi:hypothetical protein